MAGQKRSGKGEIFLTRLAEAAGKEILARAGIRTPPGRLASSADDARRAATEMGCPVAVKAQVLATGRFGKGLVRFAETPDEAARIAADIIGRRVDSQTVERVLVEERISVAREMFAAVVIDEVARSPLVVFAAVGGTGIEEIARDHPEAVARIPVDIREGVSVDAMRDAALAAGVPPENADAVAAALVNLYAAFRSCEARSLEANPLIVTPDGAVVAADCHAVVDDYAVVRHPELGVEMARELDHAPSALERAAYACEKADYRGTFFFFQMATGFSQAEGYVGFHGAGGGGSMMSMDALLAEGFVPANFCDTSGNPPASKVYRAAKIILAQPNLVGYFASGSGVASQEQFHSARGFVKAFREMNLSVPAVIRLGGNAEEIAIDILHKYCGDLNAALEAYGKDDSASFCAKRLRALVDAHAPGDKRVAGISDPDLPAVPYAFETMTGFLTFDHAKCRACSDQVCIAACAPGILKLAGRVPVLGISADDAKKGKCTECLACEIECWARARNAIRIDLPIPGYDEAAEEVRRVADPH